MKKLELSILVERIDDMVFLIEDDKEHMQLSWVHGIYYEDGMIDFIKNNYSGGTFVDAGACIGNHALAFSKIADEVISFEPLPKPQFHLMSNILLNNITNIRAYNIALGSYNGIEEMAFVKGSAGGGEVRKNGEFKVPIFKLDEFNLKDVKLIKMDVQQSEMEVLKGSKSTIKKNTPDLFIECNTSKEEKENLDFLQSVDKRYTTYPTVFNNSPTYLFTIKDHKNFKEVKNDDKRKIN